MGESNTSKEDEESNTMSVPPPDASGANPSTPNSLDETWYYYQNPTTGTVSATPLTARQLCRLLCPVREGRNPILPPHTRCLLALQQEEEEEQQQKFGEWKLATEIDILKEAACAQWFVVRNQKQSGPISCRKLLEDIENEGDIDKVINNKSWLVYSNDITKEWKELAKVKNLQLALEALKTPTAASSYTNEDTSQQEANDESTNEPKQQQIKDELEAFLSSTADGMHETEQEEDQYESDGGTKYLKDPLTGNWIHEALAPIPPPSKKPKLTSVSTAIKSNANNKKSKKAKFSKRNAKMWVYITGLPTNKKDVTVEAVQKYFSKAGLLDLDPETLKPKVKLYRHENGNLKGDASVCYARSESVDLALQILDESPWDESHTLTVQKAQFQAKTSSNDERGDAPTATVIHKKRIISQAKRKVAKLALLQAQDEGFGERLAGGRKGLKIVVVKRMMEGIPENRLEDDIQGYCQEFGPVEKITCITQSKIVIIKFKEPTAASNAVSAWHGRINERTGEKMEAIYWDGVTDYTEKEDNPEEEEKRHDEFGKWLEETQATELPPELQLKVAEDN